MTASRWSDLGRRSLSAVVLAAAALVCLAAGGALFDIFVLLSAFGMAFEWLGLCRVGTATPPGACVIGSVVLAGVAAACAAPVLGLAAAALGAIACRGARGGLMLAAGAIYLGVPTVAIIWLRGLAGGRDAVLFLLLVVWATDIGAYLIGRTIRGPKLAPALSPGKTWSGAIGGLLVALLVAGLAAPALQTGAVWLALPLTIVAQAGDLLESAIKRHVGVKDSGRWIPGHGGLLDRLDGLITAAPIAALVALIGKGGV